MNAVEVENLTFAYADGEPVLRDVSFSVSEGEVFVIAGQSGSGKTTLCHILSGIIPHTVKGRLSGQISVMNADPREIGIPQTALLAGMVFQDADSQIISMTVEDELAFALENLCRPPEEIRYRVDELSSEFGFSDLKRANPATLSCGQKKLLMIAAVCAPFPPVLILDEPMSGLDAAGRNLVTDAIAKQKNRGRTVIIVEHNIMRFTSADRWLLLAFGEAVLCDKPSVITKEQGILRDLGLI